MKHERFTYKNPDEIKAKAKELKVHLPFAENTEALRKQGRFGNVTLKNRMGIAPMEGADALPDGAPSELTLRRYVREAEGQSAMIWFEAISIVPEGRSSAHQLMLTKENLEDYKKLTAAVKEAGIRAGGFAPYLVMQANHSGRYSNPQGRPAPMIAYRHPEYEKLRAADDSCIVSDEYLKGLEEKFGEAAFLAKQAGFDAVDVKACHGYLLAELLSAYERERPISARSWIDLYYRLAYPEKFWKIVNFYYNSGKAWIPGKNQEKLERVIEQEKGKQRFLDQIFRDVGAR